MGARCALVARRVRRWTDEFEQGTRARQDANRECARHVFEHRRRHGLAANETTGVAEIVCSLCVAQRSNRTSPVTRPNPARRSPSYSATGVVDPVRACGCGRCDKTLCSKSRPQAGMKREGKKGTHSPHGGNMGKRANTKVRGSTAPGAALSKRHHSSTQLTQTHTLATGKRLHSDRFDETKGTRHKQPPLLHWLPIFG